MSSTENDAVIELNVGLQAATKDEIDEYLAKVQEIKDNLRGKSQTSSSSAKDDLEKAQDKIRKLNEKEVQKLESFLKNPEGFLEGKLEDLVKRLGPNTPLMLGIVSAITASAVLYMEILKALSQKGGPFNRDWRRLIQKEVTVGLSRLQQKRTELGIDIVILPQTRGFVPNNENWTYNSLITINESRIARIGLDDRAAGVTYG